MPTIVRAVWSGSSELSSRRLAASRKSCAWRRRCSVVMSRAITEAPITPWTGLRIGEMVRETAIRAPSARIRSVS